MTSLTPREIVQELDRFIVGQHDAKKAVALALRNRWRRLQLDEDIRDEVLPKNILMIGPTGVGKTEIARRLAKLAQAPFIKVEATKFTEIGYVGRDVEQIIRDLVDIAIHMTKEKMQEEIKPKAENAAQEKILDALVGETATSETRQKFKIMLEEGKLDDKEVELTVDDTSSGSSLDIPGLPGYQMSMINLGDLLGKAFSNKTKTIKVTVTEGLKLLIQQESEKLIDQDKAKNDAISMVEQNGIVFLDEIDKICARSERHGSDVSREGVQRDLLPLIEGTTVTTKHGQVKTDYILFITSGAFHVAKPSDLLPELQGRLPIRVELKALTQEDFEKILTEPHANLILQYKELLKTENVNLEFDLEAIKAIAELAAHINQSVENIGARRLHTILEKLLEDVSFDAPNKSGSTVTITPTDVYDRVGNLAQNTDLSRFIL